MAMIHLTINNQAVEVEAGKTILQAARENGIDIPTLCYLEGINQIGACRVCLVEIKGSDTLHASCNTMAEEGMEIFTYSPKVLAARRTNVQLILSEHDCSCPSCVRSGNCALQKLANDLNILKMPYQKKIKQGKWDQTLPLIRDDAKCIKCMRCVSVCEKIQGLGVWEVRDSGSRTTIGVRQGMSLTQAHCTYCGQCITHCPVGALRERDDVDLLLDAIRDPEITTVLQVAPAVRSAWGEALGLSKEEATEKRMAAALRRLGVDYVFDTNFTADLTIMEEGSELIERLGQKDAYGWPMFTSCCPGWMRFIKMEYPQLVRNLSTAKSPQQMFGAVAKSYFAQKIGVSPEKIFCVSVMPCTAKKFECGVPEVQDAASRDVDIVITTREADRMMRMCGIDVKNLPEEEFDSPLGSGTGAAVIFGATGGVMEAALRSAYYLVTGQNPKPDAFALLRGQQDGWKELTVDINGITLRAAVASGLGNTRKLLDAITAGTVQYDFVEIMACPGGCAGGGGQPIQEGKELAGERGQVLYAIDANNPLRFSHENPDVLALYQEYMEKPLSEKAHHLLHTDAEKWSL